MSTGAATAPAENNVARTTERKNRTSMASRAKTEGEALLKEMGFDEKETAGRRRTRASIREGTAYAPPAKKERKAPATSGTGRRGRPKKADQKKKEEAAAEEEEKEEEKAKDVEKEEEEDKKEEKEKEEDEASEGADEKETEEANADEEAEEEKEEKVVKEVKKGKKGKKEDKKKAE